jgi:hypothetical protein
MIPICSRCSVSPMASSCITAPTSQVSCPQRTAAGQAAIGSHQPTTPWRGRASGKQPLWHRTAPEAQSTSTHNPLHGQQAEQDRIIDTHGGTVRLLGNLIVHTSPASGPRDRTLHDVKFEGSGQSSKAGGWPACALDSQQVRSR